MIFQAWFMYVYFWKQRSANYAASKPHRRGFEEYRKQQLVELEEKFDTDLRVEKDFAFHQAIAQGGHNPVISSLLLIITPDILKYYQKYKVCAVPQKTVHAEHREMLQKIKDRDKEGMKELVLRHLANLIDFAKMSAKGDIPEFEYGHI